MSRNQLSDEDNNSTWYLVIGIDGIYIIIGFLGNVLLLNMLVLVDHYGNSKYFSLYALVFF